MSENKMFRLNVAAERGVVRNGGLFRPEEQKTADTVMIGITGMNPANPSITILKLVYPIAMYTCSAFDGSNILRHHLHDLADYCRIRIILQLDPPVPLVNHYFGLRYLCL